MDKKFMKGALIGIAVFAAINITAYAVWLEDKYKELTDKHNGLVNKYNALADNYNNLLAQSLTVEGEIGND